MESFRKACLIYALIFLPYFCHAQRKDVFSAGIGIGCGFGEDINNFSSTMKLHYYLFDNIRIAPSFFFYFPRSGVKMNAFAFDFNCLLPDFAPNIFDIDQKGIVFYSVAGFYIVDMAKNNRACSMCATDVSASGTFYFGFDFGIGVDYELPTSKSVWRDISVNFEIQYQVIERFMRPQLAAGLIYDF
jgi:hypothetical protein